MMANEQTSYELTEEQLNAKAAELGMDPSQLALPEYPDFKHGFGYHLRIMEAENTASPKGASQVALALLALDGDGIPVKYARSKLWLTYPFTTAQFKFKDADAHERAFSTMQALLRSTGDTRFQSARKVQEGTKVHWFDHQDRELVGKQKAAYDLQIRIRVMEELRAREKDASTWVGVQFYAQRWINEKDGQIYRNWQRITAEPLAGSIEYVFHGPSMLARHNAVEEVKHGDSDLF